MTAIAIGVTAGTARFAPEKSGLYALYIGKFEKKETRKRKYFLTLLFSVSLGLFGAALALGGRGVYFATMKTSHIEGPV